MTKSLARQELSELGGPRSVLARQKRDHVHLERLLQRLESLPPQRQGPVLLEIYRLVFPHAFAEEAVLWPTIRRVLPDGQQLTLRVELEHQAINELVSRLERMDADAPERRQVLDEVVRLLRQDVRDEEDELLPRLQAQLSQGELRRLGLAWETVRRISPTRAHAIVARRPPGNVLAALPLSILDRWRDAIDRLRQRRGGPAGKPLDAASRGLAKAAHALERLPGLRLGEHPATRIPRRHQAAWIGAGLLGLGAAVVMMSRSGRRPRRPARAIILA